MIQSGTSPSFRLPQPSNGNGRRSLAEKVHTALISIATTAIVANCAFLFKVNGSLARIEQWQIEEERVRSDQQARINSIQLKMADLEIKTTQLETKQNLKPN